MGEGIRSDYRSVHEVVELHWHEFYEMYLIVEGKGTDLINGTLRPVGPGSFCLLTPADFHELRPEPGAPLALYNVIFGASSLDEALERLVFSQEGPYLVAFEGSELAAIQADFCRLHLEARDHRYGYQLMVRSALALILIDAARRYGQPLVDGEAERNGEYLKVRRSLSYIQRHFREQLTLAQVASYSHLSSNYFSECFHRATGVTFQGYVRGLRLTFARSLLDLTDLPITSICHASGFGDLSHFERAFRRRFRMSPRDYQRARQRTGSGNTPDSAGRGRS